MTDKMKKSEIAKLQEQITEAVAEFTSKKLMPDGSLKTYALDARGAGQRFADEHMHEARYVADWCQWIAWDGKRWKRDAPGKNSPPGMLVHEFATQTAEEIKKEIGLAQDDPQVKRVIGFWRKYQTTDGKASIVAEAAPLMKITSTELDTHPDLITVGNGIVNLQSGKLEPHNSRYLMTRMTPVKYVPSARGKQWVEFKAAKYPTPKFLDWMLRLLGYMATGHVHEKKFFIAHGDSGGGKTTAQEALSHALGEYTTVGNVELIVEKPFDDMTNKGLFNHQHSRLVYISETKQGARMDVEKMKKIVSSGPITTAPKYVQELSYTPKFKVLVSTNHHMQIDFVEDNAAWDRLRVIPYLALRNSMNKRAQDSSWGERMVQNPKEQEAILADIVNGAVEWFRRGLDKDVPFEVAKATAEYRASQGSFVGFIDQQFERGRKLRVPNAVFNEMYEAYCSEHDVEPKPGGALMEAMTKLNCQKYRTGSERGWEGIGLREEALVAEETPKRKAKHVIDRWAEAEAVEQSGGAPADVQEADPWDGYHPGDGIDRDDLVACGFDEGEYLDTLKALKEIDEAELEADQEAQIRSAEEEALASIAEAEAEEEARIEAAMAVEDEPSEDPVI